MKVTDNAFELLWNKLDQIESLAISGVLDDAGREACLQIRAEVVNARQIMKNEFVLYEKELVF